MGSVSRHGLQFSIVAVGFFGCGLLVGLPSALADDGQPVTTGAGMLEAGDGGGPPSAPSDDLDAPVDEGGPGMLTWAAPPPPDSPPNPSEPETLPENLVPGGAETSVPAMTDAPVEATPLPDAATPPAPPGAVPGLPFVENFDGPAGAPPDPNLWSPVVGTGWDAGAEKYLPENAVLDGDGNLAIRAEKTDDDYTSGRVQTKDRIDFGYGTLTARIKMPSGQGLWPAFWLVGADESTNPWPGAGEIDVAEFASDPNQFHATLHGPIEDSERKFQQAQITYAGEDFTQNFHDYWMNHQVNSITVGVDDTELGTFTPESIPPDATWVYNKPFYAILNLAVGGEWAGPPDASTRFPATMLVDSIRWQPS